MIIKICEGDSVAFFDNVRNVRVRDLITAKKEHHWGEAKIFGPPGKHHIVALENTHPGKLITFNDKESEIQTVIEIGSGEGVSAYLCGDNGKTIERVM